TFAMASVDRNGDAVRANARIVVIKHEYRTVLVKNGGYFRYQSQEENKILEDDMKSIGEGFNYNFVPRTPGNYEVRVYRPGANAYVSKTFYSYGGWGENNSFEVNTEGNIDIETDKALYQSGEKAKLLFKAPFSGRLLVTVESDHVISYKYLDVNKKTASMELPLKAEHVPNIYVTATLI